MNNPGERADMPAVWSDAGAPRDAAEQAAMLSIYYHSLGRQLELRGAPSMLLPPAIRPMSLEQAVAEVTAGAGRRRREAAWALLRSAAPPPVGERKPTFRRRYPSLVRRCVEDLGVDPERYDCERETQREKAGLTAAALIAFASDNPEGLKLLYPGGDARGGKAGSAGDGPGDPLTVLGSAMPAYTAELHGLEPEARGEAVAKLNKLQTELGVSLNTFVNDYADTVAFVQAWSEGHPPPPGQMIVFPTSSIVTQDSQTLTTTATATTLVMSPHFSLITQALEPCSWQRETDVFDSSRYVESDTDLALVEVPGAAGGTIQDAPRFLREQVHVTSGVDSTRVAEFDNVITIQEFKSHERRENSAGESATLKFSLGRALSSRYLWDSRPGGILVDEGFVRVRPVGEGVWRVTARKTLQFADRSRSLSTDATFDLGQTLNYLAPAALSQWLQSEMYSSEYLQAPEDTEGTEHAR